MGSNNSYFVELNNGLGLELWYERKPFRDVKDPNWSSDSRKITKHNRDSGSAPIYTTSFTNGSGQSDYPSSFVGSDLQNVDDPNVNETSLLDIITYLQKYKSTYVSYSDFAYLKNVGVYPTNRLMIARRFSTPTPNNLYEIKEPPLATMVSWVPEDEQNGFFTINFGEEWSDLSEATFKSILDSVGSDFKGFLPEKLGKVVAAGGNIFQLSGWTEYFQNYIATKLGIVDSETKGYPPLGNPNLIRKAQHRTLPSGDQSSSGLSTTITVKFVVEYEQKFINDVDPTLIYLDIIQKALIFGTSRSAFYFGDSFGTSGNEFLKNLISGDVKAIKEALTQLIETIFDVVKSVLEELKKQTSGSNTGATSTSDPGGVLDVLGEGGKKVFGYVIAKYKVKLLAVIQAYTGAPSGYWHVTIGNPKKPFFSSGDMITSGVSMTFGKNLSFNDLPSTIKIEFTLVNARPLGGQEIFDRLNTGEGRQYFQWKRPYIEEIVIDPKSSEAKNRYANFKSKMATNHENANNLKGTSQEISTIPNNGFQDPFTGENFNTLV